MISLKRGIERVVIVFSIAVWTLLVADVMLWIIR